MLPDQGEEASPAREILATLGADRGAILAAMKDIRGGHRVTSS